MGRAVLYAAIALLLIAAPARASTPRFLGTGHDPSVAVDGNGTAHVAWPSEQNGATLEYCQVPRRKRTCAVRQSIPLTHAGAGHPQVLLPGPGRVSIVMPETPENGVVLNSFDGGASFAAVPIGYMNTLEEAVVGPGDGFSMISGTGPVSVSFYGFNGAGPAEPTVQLGEATEGLDTTLTMHEGRLAAFFSGAGRLRMVQWTGIGDPNVQANWVEGRSLGLDRSSPSAVTGPSGTFLAFVDRSRARHNTYVRQVKGMGYRKKVRRVSRQDPVELAFAQGPKGNLALVWGTEDAWISRSKKGRRWTRPKRLFRGSDPEDIRTALGPRGGWMVWDAHAGNEGSNPIRIAALPGAPRR
jgi:hypothetical protein